MDDKMDDKRLPGYKALIRTFNSAGVLARTLDSLSNQTAAPDGFVIVDSGSTDKTLSELPPGSTIHRYEGTDFNYSRALNQGLALVGSDFTLIISSHTTLAHRRALEYALSILSQDDRIGGAYFTPDTGELGHVLIDRRSFDGFNGLWNTCALVRTELARTRPFRPEVFAAEDQEWSKWFLEERGGVIARVSGAGMDNHANPNLEGAAARKWMNEYVAIAYFVRPDLMGPRSIASLVRQGVTPFKRRTTTERADSLRVAARLARCRWRAPHYGSRYFGE